MCTGAIRARKNPVLSSGGYEGGGAFATKAMSLPGQRRRSAKLPEVPILGATEEGAI
jgi:hypothetical protein